MKNRAKTISLLLAVCMMITMLPAVAMAATVGEVMIGNVKLNSSTPYYHNGANGAEGFANNDDTDYDAYFNVGDNTLTLNGLNIVNVYSSDDAKGISWAYDDNKNDGEDLTIIIADGTENIVTNTRGSAIVGKTGQGTSGPSLTIKGGTNGTGKLIVTGSSHGIWVWKNITITDKANVVATGVENNGISTNSSASVITIGSTASVFADGGKYGMGYDNNHIVSSININSSKVTSKGGSGAFQKAPTVDSGITESKNDKTSTFGTDAPVQEKNYVFFDPNINATKHDEADEPAMQTKSVASGGSVTLDHYNASGFGSWNTKDNNTGTAYADQATLTPARNMILYAQTSAAPTTYTVTYDANGGEGTMEEVRGVSGHYILPANGFDAPEGKQFKCWKVGGKEYDPLDPIDVTSDITVIAIWKDIPDDSNTGTTTTTAPAKSSIDLWYTGGNSFGSSKSAVPTAVEIDGVAVGFTGNGREFSVGCVPADAKWVTVRWNSTSVTTNFTPDAAASCIEIDIPKTGDMPIRAAIAGFLGF